MIWRVGYNNNDLETEFNLLQHVRIHGGLCLHRPFQPHPFPQNWNYGFKHNRASRPNDISKKHHAS